MKHVGEDWPDLVAEAFRILQTENDLESLVRLVGIEALPESQKLTLLVARILREGFLQQNAFNDIDTYSSPRKQYFLLKAIIGFYRSAERVIEKKIPEAELEGLPIIQELVRARFTLADETKLIDLVKRAEEAPKSLTGEIDRGDIS